MSELAIVSPSRLRNARAIRRLSSVGGTVEDGIESFWGIELTSEKCEEVWCFKVENEEEGEKGEEPDRDFMSHMLYVKMATLGKGLVKGEEHVVQVETFDKDGKPVKVPLINMVAGVNNTVCVNADFSDKHKVTFRLIEGSGPIYLSGSCLQEYPQENFDSQDESVYTEAETTATDEDEEDEEESDEEEESEEEEEMETEVKGKKAKAGMKRKPTTAAKGSKAKQRSKLESKEDSEEDSEEDEEDFDEEEEDASVKKKRGKPGVSPRPAGKNPRDNPKKKGAAAASQAADKKKGKAKAK